MFYWQDVRYAFRLLRRSPFFTLLTVVVLGGGLGLSIFTFSFLYTAMVRPLPLDGGDRIVRIQQSNSHGLEAANLALMRPQITTLSEMGAYRTGEIVIGNDGAQRSLRTTAAEWNIFQFTRTLPALGRGFLPGDALSGAEPVLVLGHQTWEVAFGADSSVVGSLIIADGAPTRVIGVMPEGYGFPGSADAWTPLSEVTLAGNEPGVTELHIYARLASGVEAAEARSELETLLANARQSRPETLTPDAETTPPTRLLVRSFPSAQTDGDGAFVFVVLNLLAALVLVLACINVTNLLLARANERARETAVRLALGATRPRLVMQSLWESVLLCAAGGILATAIAAWGLEAVNTWARTNLAGNLVFWWVWEMNATTLLVAGAFMTLTLAVVGGVVAMRATSIRINEVLQDGGARAGGRRAGRTSRTLVATQIAAVSILMHFGILSGAIAYRLAHTETGYDTSHLLTTYVDLPEDRYDTPEERGMFFEGLHERATRQPALDGVVLRARLGGLGNEQGEFVVAGTSNASSAANPSAYIQGVAGPLELVGGFLREGRALDSRDNNGSVEVAVISESLAKRYWPRAPAVGKRIRLTGLGESAQERTIVGVVRDVAMGDPLSRDRSSQAIYIPLRQTDTNGVEMVTRHRGNVVSAEGAIRTMLSDLDPLIPPPAISTLDEALAKGAVIARGVTTLFTFCFGFALLLAVSGTYGLMARSIGQRTREIGVRRALGASDRSIVRLLLGQGGRQLGIGALAALPGMLLIGVGFSNYFPIDLFVTIGTGLLVATLIMFVVLAATYIPTHKALSVAIVGALRKD